MKANYLNFLLIIMVCFSCTNYNDDSEESILHTEDIPTLDYDKKLVDLGIELPASADPVANYVNANISSSNILFLSGKGPNLPDGGYITGKVGRDLTVEEGYEAARRTAIMQISVLKATLGDLNRVKQVLKVTGMVNATDDFGNHPEVINGFSDLMVQVFGDRGKHARAAVGMSSLPRNIAVEIEAIVEVFPED